MIEKQILSAWNAVNVCGSDGLLYRGLVVDQIGTELLVDFGIPTRKPELFPLDKVFSHPTTIANLVSGGDVLFLYQLSPEHPWTWYPAKVVAACDSLFVVVEFTWENVRVRDMFHWGRFQTFYPYPYEGQLRGPPPQFGKTYIRLPDEMNDKERFFKLWKKVPHVFPVKTAGNGLYYIYDCQHHRRKLALDFCAPFIVNVAQEFTEIGQDERVCLFTDKLTTVTDEYSITDLPLDIMTDVFSYMPCTERTRLRRISPSWNDIIPSLSSQILRVDVSRVNPWTMAVTLHKCLTRLTRYVVLVGGIQLPGSPYSTAGYLSRLHTAALVQLTKLAGAQLCAIVVTKVNIAQDFLDWEDDPGFAHEFQAICEGVFLRHVGCVLHQQFSWMSGSSGQVLADGLYMRISKEFYASDKTDLSDIYEENCRVMPGAVREAVAYSIGYSGNFVQHQEPHLWLQQAFLEVIKKWQRGDPRFGPHCSWLDVEAAQLHNVDNLRTLRNTTVEVLWSVVDQFREDGLLTSQ